MTLIRSRSKPNWKSDCQRKQVTGLDSNRECSSVWNGGRCSVLHYREWIKLHHIRVIIYFIEEPAALRGTSLRPIVLRECLSQTTLTFSSLSYVAALIRNLPSSSCISLFSSKLLRTGSTLRSAFSIPSSTRTRPSTAARTAHYAKIKIHVQ